MSYLSFKIRGFFVVVLMALAAPLQAQPTPETLAEEVLLAYQQEDIEKFSELVMASPLLDNSATLSAQIKTNLRTLLDIYGPVQGWQQVNTRSASDKYLEFSYIVFQKEFATRLVLSFYQRPTGWIITSFNVDDKASNLLEREE